MSEKEIKDQKYYPARYNIYKSGYTPVNNEASNFNTYKSEKQTYTWL